MKLEKIVCPCKEIFMDGGETNISVTVNTWANGEGANIMVHGPGPGVPIRMAGSFRWEEWAVIQATMAVALAA